MRYVIVYMRSRAFRNRVDAAIVEAQLNKMGIRLISAKEDFGEGPHAVAMEGMLDVMNHLMNTLQGLDIQEKMRTKAVKRRHARVRSHRLHQRPSRVRGQANQHDRAR
ncbi:hypothetical protein ACFV24_00615 [Nocardia fluminea]|uniref:hypothetical protein n=1 Tax=Nocardia fluminea TaxID=134984 RepID=UPI0036713989